MSNAWIEQISAAQQTKKQGLVRRAIRDVERYASDAELAAAVNERGFRLLRIGDQYVLICSAAAVVLV